MSSALSEPGGLGLGTLGFHREVRGAAVRGGGGGGATHARGCAPGSICK